MIPASAVLPSDTASEALECLEANPKPASRAIARRARASKPILMADCLRGEVVRKSTIPTSLREKHGLTNLYVEDIPDFLRLPYTIVKQEATRTIVIVESVSHKDPSRWFPGRRG